MRIANETENYPKPFEEHGPIMSPSVLIFVANKRGDTAPILLFDLGEKMRAVQLHLPLRLPKTRQKNSDDRSEKQARVKAVAEIGRHARR